MLIVGLNHKTTPIEIREKFFLTHPQQDLLLLELKNHPSISEAFVLSTCNRVEVYLKRSDLTIGSKFVLDLIAKVKKIQFDPLDVEHIYTFENSDAIDHLLKVACSLDSLVLGEKQIIGQVKAAIDRARELGLLSRYFNVLSNVVIRAGKKAQSETDISCGGSSISWAAIEMAKQQLGSLKDKSVLVIGAGKMGELALANLCNQHISKLYLMNRTGEKADVLAKQYNAEAASFWDIKEILSSVDVCFCSVGAPHYILDAEKIEGIINQRKIHPLLLIDISMPRNIDPQVAQVKGVQLFSMDDLETVVEQNKQKRQGAIDLVNQIISQKKAEFLDKWQKLQSASDSDFYQAINNS